MVGPMQGFSKKTNCRTDNITEQRSSGELFYTSRLLTRIQEVATGTPVSDLSWAILEERGRPLGRLHVWGTRRLMDMSLHILRAMLLETFASWQTT